MSDIDQEIKDLDFVEDQHDEIDAPESSEPTVSAAEGTELEQFESAEVEEEEFIEEDEVVSIIESILFSTDRPQSLSLVKQAFKGTNIKTKHIKRAMDSLAVEYAGGRRGVTLEEVNGGYQLRTKVDNMTYLKRMVKGRSFKLSGPALEVLSIVAYKQPCIKSDVDEIRGVESGHLMRGLMDRGLVAFAGKSELPGRPMLYQTTRKFLEIFGLRNLKELPTLSEIDELIPEGIGDEDEKDQTLDQLTGELSQETGTTYSEGEEELMKITDQLSGIETSSEFFEEEKKRQKAKREAERAQDIRDALAVGEDVSTRDIRWLERYEETLAVENGAPESEEGTEPISADSAESTEEIAEETIKEEVLVQNEDPTMGDVQV
jgi:segregation and condensation protein B